MKNFLTVVVGGIATSALVFILAVFTGTLVFLLWPLAIPSVFPGLVASGVIAARLTWRAAVALTWLCGILIKNSTTVKTKKD